MVGMGGARPSYSPEVFSRDENVGIAYGMGLTAEKVASQWKVSREAQDAFALQSHQRALAAIAKGEFAGEITPFETIERHPNLATGEMMTSQRVVSIDEGPRADSSLEALAKLSPVFAAKGRVTAGNSSQTSDGAACLILASEKAIAQHGLTPLARFVSFASKGVAPEVMGIGPIEAIPLALRLAGITQEQLDWIELNEAFAAQALAVLGSLQLDPAKVNPLGGAIALGHPLGATGAVRATTVVHALRRHQLGYGMVTMCVGTGQGVAGIFERV
jgi:acetyl-CoA acyltransferase